TDGNGCEKTRTVSLFVASVTDLNREQVLLYPNPASSSITIETIVNLQETATVSIYNALGQNVKQTSLYDKKQTIDVSELPDGVYACRINNVHIQSFVKK